MCISFLTTIVFTSDFEPLSVMLFFVSIHGSAIWSGGHMGWSPRSLPLVVLFTELVMTLRAHAFLTNRLAQVQM